MILPAPFATLSHADSATLARSLEHCRLEAGETLFRAGDAGDATYWIDEGEIRLEVPRPELDSDSVLAVLGPGSILGELSLLDGLPRSATAVADGPVRLRRLTAESLSRLSDEHPRLAAAVLTAFGEHAARKLRQSNQLLTEHVLEEGRDREVDEVVERAAAAQAAFQGWDEPRVDAMLRDIAETIALNAEALAKESVEETRVGDVGDKTIKNTYASIAVYRSMEGKPGAGPLGPPSEDGVVEIAAPVGVVFGLIPMTNPVATAIYKTLIALKARNALILSFHRRCSKVGERTAGLIHEALRRHDAPEDLVQAVVGRSDRRKTVRFMSHEGVALVLATGGPGMVKAAYSSGTPAIGVGSGNAPTWITSTADVEAAAMSVVVSKSFDNGLICGSEHNLVVDAAVRDAFIAALEGAGAAVLDPAETARFTAGAIVDGTALRPEMSGQAAARIAAALGITRPYDIRLLVVPADLEQGGPLAGEKMAPLLSLFTVQGEEEGLAACLHILGAEGTGHTAIIHSRDQALIDRFGAAMPASRILVDSPGSQGVCGLTTGLTPAFTLGCGTFGGNSTTDNVSYRNLQNIKRLAVVQPERAY